MNQQMVTSSELAAWIAGAQAGDAECFDRLIDAYADRLYGYFIRLTGSESESEDLLQEFFIKLVRGIRDYRHRDRFDAFVFCVAANLFRDWIRRRQRSKEVTGIEGDESEPADESRWADVLEGREDAPSGPLEQKERCDVLRTALARLPLAEREVIVMRHFSELSFDEVARIMGTPLGTALARSHRGLAKLREWIEGPE